MNNDYRYMKIIYVHRGVERIKEMLALLNEVVTIVYLLKESITEEAPCSSFL